MYSNIWLYENKTISERVGQESNFLMGCIFIYAECGVMQLYMLIKLTFVINRAYLQLN